MNNVEEVRLLAVREGTYTMYVFQNIHTNQYIMCTRLPNWQVPEINLQEVGFLEYQKVKAGETYYDPKLEVTTKYNYSNIYFHNFVRKSDILKNNEIIL